MKKIVFVTAFLFGTIMCYSQLSSEEKNLITGHMASSLQTLTKSVEGLSEAQLNFKPDSSKWSIKECVYHLALSESNIWSWMQGLMAAPANPDKRALITMTDAQLLAALEDRSRKNKTSEPFEPKNATWKSKDEAIAFLKTERGKHIDYLTTASDDFRNHVAEQGPAGPMDAYQVLLLMSQHTVRHAKQIDEVKTLPGYPGK